MKICHVCKVECEDSAELCPVCGAVLRDEALENAEEVKEDIIKKPTILATMEDVVSAEILKDILGDNGILFSCDGNGNDGAMQVIFGGNFVAEEIYVDESDFEAANKLYNEFLESEANMENQFIFEDEISEEE